VPFSAYGPASEPILEPEQETSLLAAEAERLRSMLESIEKRLERLKNE
jgi:ubiquinone biosynthesis protein UbiJ